MLYADVHHGVREHCKRAIVIEVELAVREIEQERRRA